MVKKEKVLTSDEKDKKIKSLQKDVIRLEMDVDYLEGKDFLDDHLRDANKWEREEAFLRLSCDPELHHSLVVLNENCTSGSDVVALRNKVSSSFIEFLKEVVK